MFAFGAFFATTFWKRAATERAVERLVIKRVERDLAVALGIGAPATPGALVEHLLGGLPGRAKEVAIIRRGQPDDGRDARGSDADTTAEPPIEPDGDAPKALVSGIYRRLLDDLIHELRVFAGINCGLFALTTLLAGWRRQDTRHLLLPAGLLAGTTCVAVVSYFAAQEWSFAFLTGDYIGYWYLVLICVVSSFLADIAFNRARITSLFDRGLWQWLP
jgi:hypothetical protein